MKTLAHFWNSVHSQRVLSHTVTQRAGTRLRALHINIAPLMESGVHVGFNEIDQHFLYIIRTYSDTVGAPRDYVVNQRIKTHQGM